MITIIILFIVNIFFCIWNPPRENRYAKTVFWIFSAILIITIGFRGEIDNDYASYKEMFTAKDLLVEPSFILITTLLRDVFGAGIVALMLVYAIISVLLKFKTIERYSNFLFLSLAIWMGNLMVVQEMTQIRAAVASGIFLLSLNALYEHNWKKYLIFVLAALLFHWSALLMLPLWFLSSNRINKWWWICVVVGGYVLSINHIYMTSLLSLIPIPAIQSKIEVYGVMTSGNVEDGAAIFGMFQITKIIIFTLLLWNARYLAKFNKYVFLMLKIMACGLVALPLFRNNIVAGLRITEFLTCIDILLFPMIVYLWPVWTCIGQGLIICYSGAILYGRLFIEKLLNN